MLKQSILSIVAVCLGLFAFAQEARLPVIVAAAQGKPLIYRSPDGGGKMKLITGAAIKRDGSLQLKKGSRAMLFYNGDFQLVEGKKIFSLAEVFPNQDNPLLRLDFQLTFVDYLSAAINLAADPDNTADAWGGVKTEKGTGDGWGEIKTVKGTGDGWGGVKTEKGTGDGWGSVKSEKGTGDGWGSVKTEKGTGDGWGGKGKDITAILPFGLLLPQTTTFSWSKPAGATSYQVSILDMNGNTLAEKVVKDTFCTFDLALAPFVAGTNYQWRAAALDNPASASNALPFALSDAAAQAAATMRAENSALYAQSPQSLRSLMRAVALERSDWYVAAAETYREVQKEDPKNEIARLMHAAFWMRYGLKEMATQAYGH
jgi:hypothetical protein